MKAVKVRIRKASIPKMPSAKQISDFCGSLSDDDDKRAFLECCIALSLAIAPDCERDLGTVYCYACHFADGFTQNTLEAVRLWAGGELNENTHSDIPDLILDNFRRAYLFRWQRKLILFALERFDTIKDKAPDICSDCCVILSEYSLRNTSLLRLFNI